MAGTAVVESGKNEFEFKFYSAAKTKDGKDNSRYANYQTLEARVGERVRVNGELSGRIWYNDGQAQMVNFNELSAGFFNQPKPTEVDTSTFEYSGFVTKGIHERMNKEEELIGYEIEIAQANYNGDNMQIVKFMVDKDNARIYNAILNAYQVGMTVAVSGEIHYVVVMEEKVEEVMFGDPIVKTFQNTRKSFEITGGKTPIIEDGLAYSQAQIAKLQTAYNAYLAKVESDAKNKGTVTKNEPAQTSSSNGLL